MPGASKCFLRCCRGLHPDILLSDLTQISVGRGPDTKIKDKRCSREQMALTANYQKYQVKLTQLGLNLGKFQEKELRKDESVVLRHGDKFDILSGEYQHKVIFDPAPPKKENLEEKSAEISTKEEAPPPTKKQKLAAESPSSKTKQSNKDFKKSEIKITTLKRSSDKIVWEEGADGQLYIMTFDNCQPSDKVSPDSMELVTWLLLQRLSLIHI